MSDVEDAVGAARLAVAGVMRLAGHAIRRGLDPDRIHHDYVERAVELLSEVEINALLAVEGEAGALDSVMRSVEALEILAAELERELDDQRNAD